MYELWKLDEKRAAKWFVELAELEQESVASAAT